MTINSTNPYVQRTGNRVYFGDGSDGTVTISVNTFISRDMYYDTLTVNANTVLFTNGFKVSVKNTLTNNGSIGMPKSLAQTSTEGQTTLSSRTNSDSGSRIGGTGNDSVSLETLYGIKESSSGSKIGSDATVVVFKGGKRGATGSSGTANPGNAGGSGGAATKPGAGSLVPGGSGTAGNAGNPGSGQTGGTGGTGGGVVAVFARIILGSGTFVSEGSVGEAATGVASSGNAGNAGTTAPTQTAHHAAAYHSSHPTAAYHYHAVSWPAHGNHNHYLVGHGAMTGHALTPAAHTPTYPGGAGGSAGTGGSGNAGTAGTDGTDGTVVVYTESIPTPLSTTKKVSIDLND